MALVPPLSGGMTSQHFARNPVLVNKRLSAACYRPQTLASDLAKSLYPLSYTHLVPYCSLISAIYVLHRPSCRGSSVYTTMTAGSWSDAHHNTGIDSVQDVNVYRFSCREWVNVLR